MCKKFCEQMSFDKNLMHQAIGPWRNGGERRINHIFQTSVLELMCLKNPLSICHSTQNHGTKQQNLEGEKERDTIFSKEMFFKHLFFDQM